MKAKSLFITAALSLAPFVQSFADDSGATLFKTVCGACHTIGKGKLVGPDLKGVQDRHPEAWILKWVKGSQAMVKAGDPAAVKLFNDNSSIPMPDQPLNDDQIKSILAYIKSESVEQPAAAAAPAVSVQNNGIDQVTIATEKTAKAQAQESGGLLSMFSFTEYILMFLMIILLLVIWVLATSIKSLSEKKQDQTA